jgi:hypothetical protein
VIALWVVALGYLVRAASAAGQGGQFQFPPWLCAAIAR